MLGRKSWTASVAVIAISLAGMHAIVPAAWRYSPGAGGFAAVALAGGAACAVLAMRSFRMYCDEAGVWLHWAMRPFGPRITCLQWRDIERASWSRDMWSGISSSSTVRIALRGSRRPLTIPHMTHAEYAATQINSIREELARENLLE